MTRKGWAHYGINRWQKIEIRAFCRQYEDWKKEISYGLRAVSTGSGGSRGNAIGRPTEQQAIHNTEIQKNIDIIENAIREICPQIFDQMLNNIGYGIAYEYMEIPYSRADFYALRIKVYYLILLRRKR